jgi:hypothetical protein
MHTTIRHWLSAAALLLAVLMSTNVTAAPVVVGSINPATRQITIFQDILVTSFQDGTPIYHIYGDFNEASQELLMIRIGKTSEDVCQTDVLRLLRISGNRLALAADHQTQKLWDGVGTLISFVRCTGVCLGVCQYRSATHKCDCNNELNTCDFAFKKDMELRDIVLLEDQ